LDDPAAPPDVLLAEDPNFLGRVPGAVPAVRGKDLSFTERLFHIRLK
jgi:hypothetical protein